MTKNIMEIILFLANLFPIHSITPPAVSIVLRFGAKGLTHNFQGLVEDPLIVLLSFEIFRFSRYEKRLVSILILVRTELGKQSVIDGLFMNKSSRFTN